MNYSYIRRVHDLANKMANDHYKGQPYRLSEFNRVYKPAAAVSVDDTAEIIRDMLIKMTDMSSKQIESYLSKNGFIK